MTTVLRDYWPLWLPALALAIYVPLLVRGLRRGHRTPQIWVEPEEEAPWPCTYIEGPVDLGHCHESAG